ncbi:hypothetical protein ACA910_012904 [Epithemia clementina (nom. ined.)]
MTHFTGICTFPHGPFISAGLLLATCCAFVATAYAVASCRLVVLSFVSDTGNFEQSFSRFNTVQTEAFQEYKVALGLFQWLRPDEDTWDDGTCVGYQQSMLEAFADNYFDMARVAGSMSVLVGVMVVLWAVVNACIAWNIWQIIILAFLLLSGTVAAALSFIFLKSEICNDKFSDSSCSIDESGLVLVAGSILWLSGFLITVIFMRTLDSRVDDFGLSELERARAREMALIKDKRAREKERLQRQRAEARERQLAQLAAVPSGEDEHGMAGVVVTPTTAQSYSSDEGHRDEVRIVSTRRTQQSRQLNDTIPPNVTVVDDEAEAEPDEYEVYINTRMQRVDEILRDIQDTEDRHPSNSEKQHSSATNRRSRATDHADDENGRSGASTFKSSGAEI